MRRKHIAPTAHRERSWGSGMTEDEYYVIRSQGVGDLLHASRPRPLRVAVLFSTAMVALALLAVPQLKGDDEADVVVVDGSGARTPAIDPLVTGSIERNSVAGAELRNGLSGSTDAQVRTRSNSTYVLRRSVLQGRSICIIKDDGTRSGAC